MSTFQHSQNKDGGFGGGQGQMSHLASTYATVLSIIVVGGKQALDLVDRKAMWHYLGRMKQKDGGFTMSDGGEEDVRLVFLSLFVLLVWSTVELTWCRGAYCALTIASLFNLPLNLPPESPARVTGNETLLTGLGEWIGKCQSYEGGIGGAPGFESHGAYTFCGLACLCVMGPPNETIPK